MTCPDRVFGTRNASLTHANPHAHHIVVPHGGHCMPRYHPDVIATAITDLVDRIRTPVTAATRPTTPCAQPKASAPG